MARSCRWRGGGDGGRADLPGGGSPPAQGGLVGQEIHSVLTVLRNDLARLSAPGKGDRLVQFLYSQMPYHPQRIEKGTAWTVETTAALAVPAEPAEAVAAANPVAAPVARHSGSRRRKRRRRS